MELEKQESHDDVPSWHVRNDFCDWEYYQRIGVGQANKLPTLLRLATMDY